MEEKKKSRPTWAMVRELEGVISRHMEDKHALVVQCDEWREKYRELVEFVEKHADVSKYSELQRENEELRERVDELTAELSRLRSSGSRRGLLSSLFWKGR